MSLNENKTMNNTNWDEVLIRCSSLSCLFTEPKTKADKEAGLLSKTAQSHLVKVYVRELWGREKDLVTKQMEKGLMCEEEALKMLSIIEGKVYYKNEFRHSNGWITGHPDIIEKDEIIDIKCSWDAETFAKNLVEDVPDAYFYQLQGYMMLTGRKKARITYCLCDTPDSIIEGEKYRLLKAMDVATELNPKYQEALANMIFNMKFDDIPKEQRVIHQFVDRDDAVIEKIPEKVERAREFLKELHKKHIKKAVSLV